MSHWQFLGLVIVIYYLGPLDKVTVSERRMISVDTVKWTATFIQLIGYGMTGLNYTPWNFYIFNSKYGLVAQISSLLESLYLSVIFY